MRPEEDITRMLSSEIGHCTVKSCDMPAREEKSERERRKKQEE